MKFSFFVLISLYLSIQSHAASSKLNQEIVPDKKTALKIAEAVLVPVYGEKILKQRPFIVKQEDNRWIVDGTLHCPDKKTCKGGVAHVEINKKTGAIIQMIHGW